MDAERIAVDYLNGHGIGATAYYDVPPSRPSSFVVVERTGGDDSDIVVETPMLDLQCWAQTRRDAAMLADSVKEALAGMPDELPDCFHVSITSTFRDTDLESGTPRYHVVAEITLNR